MALAFFSGKYPKKISNSDMSVVACFSFLAFSLARIP
jgi:hypothetical protein